MQQKTVLRRGSDRHECFTWVVDVVKEAGKYVLLILLLLQPPAGVW